MDEYLDIVTEDGKPTGKSELKSIIHKNGYYHNTAHIWFYTHSGNILLSQRSAKKIICPLLWDVSVAGHIDAGESIETGAVREIFEEIGLSISKNSLQKIGVFKSTKQYSNSVQDNEFHHTYICALTTPVSNLKIQQNEVEAIKLVSVKAFQSIIKHIGVDNHLVPSNKAYYEFVLRKIIEVLKLNF